jgi:CHAD domain-containing protein
MSYRLQRNEAPGEGVRRICLRQVELALAIATGRKETEDTPVHETRKHLKKARAALRLVRREIGRGLFKRQDDRLRDIGRMISELRDAEVRLQTVRQLQSVTPRQRRSYQKVEETLMHELENFVAAFADWQTQTIPFFERLYDEIDGWPVDQFDFIQLQRSVQATYKRGRDALAAAKRAGTAESFHNFRKEAKQLWYQLRILRPVNPVVLKTLADELGSLGDLLGRAHDLDFLGERMRQEADQNTWKRESHELLAVIEASQSDLQRGAGDLAERFYAERPRDFGARVVAWLDAWVAVESPSVADALVNNTVETIDVRL